MSKIEFHFRYRIVEEKVIPSYLKEISYSGKNFNQRFNSLKGYMCFKNTTFSLTTIRESVNLCIQNDMTLLINKINFDKNILYKNEFDPIENWIKKTIIHSGGKINQGYAKNYSIFNLIEKHLRKFNEKSPIHKKLADLFVPYQQEFIDRFRRSNIVIKIGLIEILYDILISDYVSLMMKVFVILAFKSNIIQHFEQDNVKLNPKSLQFYLYDM